MPPWLKPSIKCIARRWQRSLPALVAALPPLLLAVLLAGTAWRRGGRRSRGASPRGLVWGMPFR
jgi:hypothetical protein